MHWRNLDTYRSLFVAAAVGLAGVVPAAEPASGEPAPVLEEVVVTGSRIAAPNAVSTSPIQVITSDDIKIGGQTDIGDIISRLPQNFTNDLGQDLGNGTSGLSTPGGVATADLRGLGPNRTLVLVDGRRLGQGSPNTFIASPAPDLDQIPAGLVERVEVVTGGASATYGADAVAGVVNFITKKNFEGVQLDGEYDMYYHHNGNTWMQNLVSNFNGSIPATGTAKDGYRRDFDLLMGTNFADGKGNVTAFLSYRHQDPVAASQRDFGGCQLNPTFDTGGNVNGVDCHGSANSNWFEIDNGPNAGIYSVHGTSLVPFGSVPTTPPSAFNSQQYIYMTREDDRYNAAFLAHDDLADYAKPYAEFFFMDDRSHTQIAPAALFQDNILDPLGAGYNYTNCSNPLLSTQERNLLCTTAQQQADAAAPGSVQVPLFIGRRNVEGGGRFSDFEHQNFRFVVGMKGELGEAWNYDAYGQYYYTTLYNANEKFFNMQQLSNALLVTTDGTGHPVCISGGTCVPYNLWSDGGVTDDQLKYLYSLGTAQGSSALRTLHGEVTGYLGKYGVTSPWSQEGVAVNIGVEHRVDQEKFSPDGIEESGLLEGFGSAAVAVDNSLKVTDTFTEVRAPLVQDKTAIKDLILDAGYRRSQYSVSGGVNTYKLEVQYAPVDDYRLRYSFARAIRAPSVVELYNPQLVGLVASSGDPCAPTFDNNNNIIANAVYDLQQCERTGVTAAQYGNGGTTDKVPQGTGNQLQQLTGGNPNLKPEQGNTYTLGLNFSPHQLPGFSGSLDYYRITIKGIVGPLASPDAILKQCATTGDPIYCSQIVRNGTTGGLKSGTLTSGGYIVQSSINVAGAQVSGLDLQLNYRHGLPAGWGSLNVAMNGAYLQKATTTPTPGTTYDCAGLFGYTCQTINPRWHHQLRTSWVTPWNVTASLTWRYIGSVSQDNNSNDPYLHFTKWGGYDYFAPRIHAYSYFDLAATWKAARFLELRAGISNLADKDPPVVENAIVGGGAANTYSIYDMFGRQLFFAVTAKL